MKKIIAATLLAIVVVVSTACGPKPPAQTPNCAPWPTETTEEASWCERNFKTCMTLISLGGGMALGFIGAGVGIAIDENSE